MFRFLTGFIVGCLIMYIGPIEVANSVIKTTKTITQIVQKEYPNDGPTNTRNH